MFTAVDQFVGDEHRLLFVGGLIGGWHLWRGHLLLKIPALVLFENRTRPEKNSHLSFREVP